MNRESESIYKRDIEPAVLRESEAFYRNEGRHLLEVCDAPEYLRRVSSQSGNGITNTH